MTNLCIQTRPVVATSTSDICSECGTIQKSGKSSCCGYGGSWFGHCRSVGKANVVHTWNEGIWACKARQFQSVPSQQLHFSQTKSHDSFNDSSIVNANASIMMSSHTLTTSVKTIATTTVTIILPSMPLLTRKVSVSPVNGTSTPVAHGTIKSMRGTLSDTSVTTAFLTSGSASIGVREFSKLFYFIGHINMLFITICW